MVAASLIPVAYKSEIKSETISFVICLLFKEYGRLDSNFIESNSDTQCAVKNSVDQWQGKQSSFRGIDFKRLLDCIFSIDIYWSEVISSEPPIGSHFTG